jgi:hypothetical protein
VRHVDSQRRVATLTDGDDIHGRSGHSNPFAIS